MRAVFFDLVGTLIRGRKPIGEQYAEELGRFGIATDPSRLTVAFRQTMAAAPSMAFPGRSEAEAGALEREWWRSIVRKVTGDAGLDGRLEGPLFERFFESLFDRFTTALAWELYPDALPALSGLRAKGLALGLITNYDSRVHPLLHALGLAPLLDVVAIPAQVGASKPDPAIFLHALARLNLPAGEALHVGDELDDDYRGAEAAGMGAVLLDRSGRHANLAGVRRLESLAGLLKEPGSPVGTP